MRPTPLLALLLTLVAVPAAAQDVEMLGRRYGTRPPPAYYETLRQDPGAFQFARGRTARMRRLMEERGREGEGDLPALREEPALALGPREGRVEGTFPVPVLLGLFGDSPHADSMRYGRDTVQTAYFGVRGGATITDYYREVSRGLATLDGDVQYWVRSSMTRLEATGGRSGLGFGLVGPFILDLLAELPPDMDWSAYDNDGPDGVPNSGDDDGFVDVLAVIQPTPGAECDRDEDRIWSHRWSLSSAAGSVYTTATPSAGGGFIKVDDYVIQPVFACNGSDLSEIGVFTHELGHAFGLPDLYDTRLSGGHQGAGEWALMASGSWGCDGNSPDSPCHMSAWSKAALGWVDVEVLPADSDLGTLTLPPVASSGLVYRMDAADGSDEYFLLENRQWRGFDRYLRAEGMLVWQIDQGLLERRWPWNGVNASDHMAVWLRQADGLDELGTAGGDRGDAGDVFPASGPGFDADAFHAATNPAARSWEGAATGLTLTDIRTSDDDVLFRALTRFTSIRVRSEGDEGTTDLFTVDGLSWPGNDLTITDAPFVEHTVETAPGEPLEEGIRRPFTGWTDDGEASRSRTLVTPISDVELVAGYGGRQVALSLEVSGGVNGVEPGTLVTEPASEDLWFEEGAAVEFEAVAQTGFRFLTWTGGLAGRPNPTTLTMDAPLSAGADFELTYEVPSTTVELSAAVSQDLTLTVENGTAPFAWRRLDGELPEGLRLGGDGRLTGAAMETGAFPVTLEATDALGLTGQGTVTLEVAEPELSISQLASPFLLVGDALDDLQRQYLNRVGNGQGGYDLGDFRVWVLDHPGLPLSGVVKALIAEPRTVVLPTAPVPAGDARDGEGGSR